MTPEAAVSLVLFAALVLYVLTGGADFGGGLWDLLATGPRASAQRRVIARAIGPIWEANHVWLILVIVVMFVCFPKAYALIGTALHIPLTLMLVGVVLRGSAFVFRTYDSRRDHIQRRWSVVFASASAFTPVMLGVCVGAAVSGRLTVVDGVYTGGFVAPWVAPFPLAVGGFTLALFALLAAVYLLVDIDDPDLRNDFRARALGASAAVFGFAWAALLTSRSGAPHLWAGLTGSSSALVFQAVVAMVGVGLVGALFGRRYPVARGLAVGQVVLLIGGFGLVQYPWIITGALTARDAAGPENVLRGTIAVLAVGAPPLGLAYVWMLRVFRQHALSATPSAEALRDNA